MVSNNHDRITMMVILTKHSIPFIMKNYNICMTVIIVSDEHYSVVV